MSLTAVWVRLWWKAVGRCWLRKSVCCSLVPCRDHLRQKVLELQLSIASPSVQLVSSGPAPAQCSCTGPGPILASLLLHLGKANQTLFALSLQHRFPVRACLRSALTCIQLLHAPSMEMSLQSDCSRIQNFDLFFFYNVVGMMSSNRPSKENVEQHEELEFSISHRVLLYLSSPLSQEDKISSENLSLVIFD